MVECKQRTSIFANLKLFIHIIDQGKHSDQDSLNASSLLLEPEPATTGLRYAGQMRLSTRAVTASGPVSLPRMLSLIHTTMGAVGSELTLDLKTDFFTNCDRQPVFIRGRFHDIWLDIHFMKLGAVNIGLARNSYILPEVPFGRPAARTWTMSYSGSDRISLRRKQWPITNDLAYTVEGSAIIDYELFRLWPKALGDRQKPWLPRHLSVKARLPVTTSDRTAVKDIRAATVRPRTNQTKSRMRFRTCRRVQPRIGRCSVVSSWPPPLAQWPDGT
jgi:hypothetical protein